MMRTSIVVRAWSLVILAALFCPGGVAIGEDYTPDQRTALEGVRGALATRALGDAESAVLAFKTRFTADFQCRLILQDVGPGRSFGLYPGTAGDAPIVVSLPEGSVKVEFQRKGNAYTCRVNDEEVEVPQPRKSGERMQGYLGVTLASDPALVVALFEFAGR